MDPDLIASVRASEVAGFVRDGTARMRCGSQRMWLRDCW